MLIMVIAITAVTTSTMKAQTRPMEPSKTPPIAGASNKQIAFTV